MELYFRFLIMDKNVVEIYSVYGFGPKDPIQMRFLTRTLQPLDLPRTHQKLSSSLSTHLRRNDLKNGHFFERDGNVESSDKNVILSFNH